MVSGFKTSPLESAKIDSGEARPMEILLNFFCTYQPPFYRELRDLNEECLEARN